MSASKAPEDKVVVTALLTTHLVRGCPVDMEHWLEAESELMRLYDEYTAVELSEMMQPTAWAKSFRLD